MVINADQTKTTPKKNKHVLRHPYQTRAKTKIMSEIEEVQEQMKADMEAMKDQMTSMMSMRRMMEDNMAAVATTITCLWSPPISTWHT